MVNLSFKLAQACGHTCFAKTGDPALPERHPDVTLAPLRISRDSPWDRTLPALTAVRGLPRFMKAAGKFPGHFKMPGKSSAESEPCVSSGRSDWTYTRHIPGLHLNIKLAVSKCHTTVASI